MEPSKPEKLCAFCERIYEEGRAVGRQEALAESGWQPIETAPKMKTILLFAVVDVDENDETRNWLMETGFYHTGYEDGHDNSLPWNWGGHQVKTYDIAPTHWKPLPEPPE